MSEDLSELTEFETELSLRLFRQCEGAEASSACRALAVALIHACAHAVDGDMEKVGEMIGRLGEIAAASDTPPCILDGKTKH